MYICIQFNFFTSQNSLIKLKKKVCDKMCYIFIRSINNWNICITERYPRLATVHHLPFDERRAKEIPGGRKEECNCNSGAYIFHVSCQCENKFVRSLSWGKPNWPGDPLMKLPSPFQRVAGLVVRRMGERSIETEKF